MNSKAAPAGSSATVDLTGTLERLLDGCSLDENEAADLLVRLTETSLPPAVAGAALAALRSKGETAAELRGLSGAMRRLALRPQIRAATEAVDLVGTGGDRSNSLNLSTGASLVAAAAGVPVIKHGNRAVSSRSGSADVLEALGYTLPRDPHSAARSFRSARFTFLYAPIFHPAMSAIAGVRRALGVRTVFNVLGPLTNPAQPAYGVIGAFSHVAAQRIADALSGMPIARYFVVHGDNGWDEATPVCPFLLFDVRPGRVETARRDPARYGFRRRDAGALLGSGPRRNARAIRAVFEGEPGAHRDALVLGAALALEVSGAARDLASAAARAARAIDTGKARGLLRRLRERE